MIQMLGLVTGYACVLGVIHASSYIVYLPTSNCELLGAKIPFRFIPLLSSLIFVLHFGTDLRYDMVIWLFDKMVC